MANDGSTHGDSLALPTGQLGRFTSEQRFELEHPCCLEYPRSTPDAYSQAALKWSLSNANVSSAIISFFEPQHVDEYLYASGKPFASRDVALLDEYDRQTAGTHCAPHCAIASTPAPPACRSTTCSATAMYFEDYGWEKEGIEQYARLQKESGGLDASLCANCPAPCANTCPLGIDIEQRMAGAHELLTISRA